MFSIFCRYLNQQNSSDDLLSNFKSFVRWQYYYKLTKNNKIKVFAKRLNNN